MDGNQDPSTVNGGFMKSQTYASPATDEEIIELTDVVKSGPEAEEVIIDLTDPIETVKAEPYDPSPGTADVSIEASFFADVSTEAFSVDEAPSIEAASSVEADALMDLDEIVIDDVEELVDLTEPLDLPTDTVALEGSEEILGEEEEILDLNDTFVEDNFADNTAEALDIDLVDAFESAAKVLDLDEAPQDDGAVLDQPQATGALEEIEADSDILDLAEALDSAEADSDADAAPVVDEALEVIEAEPVELTDEFLDEDFAEPAEPVLDQPLEAAGSEASTQSDGLLPDADDGDDLVFELDEMLAQAQAEMPDMEDDGTEMELDLSEALADAAAHAGAEHSGASNEETILDLEGPLETTPPVSDKDAEDLDLISADNIIDLEEMTSSENIAEVTATAVDTDGSALDNVISLADVTGGYPTVPPATEGEMALADTATDGEGDLTEDDHGMEAETANDELASEMQKLEARLDDVFQDDMDEDFDLVDAVPADDLSDEVVLAEEVSEEVSFDEEVAETAAPNEEVADTAAAVTASALADTAMDVGSAAPGGDAADFTSTPPQAPLDITPEALDAAVERVIKTMYADRIEQMILDVIKEAVMAEIEKVKRSLGETGTDTD